MVERGGRRLRQVAAGRTGRPVARSSGPTLLVPRPYPVTQTACTLITGLKPSVARRTGGPRAARPRRSRHLVGVGGSRPRQRPRTPSTASRCDPREESPRGQARVENAAGFCTLTSPTTPPRASMGTTTTATPSCAIACRSRRTDGGDRPPGKDVNRAPGGDAPFLAQAVLVEDPDVPVLEDRHLTDAAPRREPPRADGDDEASRGAA